MRSHQNPTGTAEVAVRLVPVPPSAMRALVDGDLELASSLTGIRLSPFLASEECTWLWRVRLAQADEDPSSAHWVARAAVAEPGGQVVGHAGFHGPPDESGTVEVGYTVDPAFRRRGYARAMVRALLAWAWNEEGVRTVRASISPGNEASLATIRPFGFERTGEQWDEDDGLEIVHELTL
ncbi:MAG TPA: GNAT family N-acetyltransferase [Nocardioidaceae bacterium]|nr:GNAT family N-acetyltransferase [Nocardioidaceae bacterium]